MTFIALSLDGLSTTLETESSMFLLAMQNLTPTLSHVVSHKAQCWAQSFN